MAHLTKDEREKLRDQLSHYDGCDGVPATCERCLAVKLAVMENVGWLLEDLDQADERRDGLVADLTASVSEAREAEEDRERAVELQYVAEAELKETKTGDMDTQALCNWAFDAGAELPDLRCSAGTYDVARLALLARGGPACSSYTPAGSSDNCKCGKPYREHRRELQGA